MSAGQRDGWSIVSPGRLAEIVERLSAERRPERHAAAAVDAALAATGARGGRVVVVAPDGTAAVAAGGEGPPPDATVIGADLSGARGRLGRLEVWGCPDGAEAEAALRLLAAVYARELEGAEAERERTRERRRARLLDQAASAVRGPGGAPEAVARILAQARELLGAPAAALVAAGTPGPEVAAYDGIDPLDPAELELLVPEHVRAPLVEGRWWSGPLPAGSGPAARGLGHAAIVGVGERAALGILVVLRAGSGFGEDDLEALGGLAGHAATALTLSVLQQEVRELGVVDPTTRFYNARYFALRLDQECQRAMRTGAPISVAIMGLDGIAALRAEGQILACESAMEALARHVTDRLRGMDVGCRLDGDDLAIILPEVEGLDALRVGERLRATLRNAPGLDGRFTLSVGIASFPAQAGRADSLGVAARSALDWARAHGGDRTFLYHAETEAILRAEAGGADPDDEAVLTTVAALAASIDARHPSTVFHSENVGRIAALIAAELGLPLDRVEDVRVAGLLHDVGKIGVSEDIVASAEPLDEEQERELRRHPEIGERMLAGSRLAIIGPWVLHHHERMDGGGYPYGLAGEAIPLEARILAVADAYDRLASGGPGRMAIPGVDALAALEREAGTAFDPVAVAALRALVGRGAADITPRGS